MRTRGATVVFGEQAVPVDMSAGRGDIVVRAGNHEMTVALELLGTAAYALTVGGRRLIAHYVTDGTRHFLHVDGECYVFTRDPADAGRRTSGTLHQDLRAPMPGLVTRVFVVEGQALGVGEPLFAVEAMKMEHVVRTARACRVTKVHTAPGAQVEGGAVVVEVEDLLEAPS